MRNSPRAEQFWSKTHTYFTTRSAMLPHAEAPTVAAMFPNMVR